MTEFFKYMTGENGGIMAVCFMGGIAIGYSFAQKTVIAEAKRRILKLEARVEELTNKLLGHEDADR